MAIDFAQDDRVGSLTTALGENVLVLTRFDGSDYVNDLFEYQVEAVSTEPGINFDDLIGTHATVKLESQNTGTQIFDGIVAQARWAGSEGAGNRYILTLRPWLWVAGRKRQQRIFKDLTAVEIIEEVFSTYGPLSDADYETRLTGNYPTLEYTVQYRESDLNFARRLMERFAISFHFVHSEGVHKLILTDSAQEHDPVPGDERPFFGAVENNHNREECFTAWHPERNLVTGAVRLTDFNFKTPTASMQVDRTGDAAYAQGQIEAYDYPGDYLDSGEGRDMVARKLDQERAQDNRHYAEGDCILLCAGMLMTLTGDKIEGCTDEEYICLAAHHHFSAEAYGSGEDGSQTFSARYTFAPSQAPLAPVKKTHVPVVHGPQTATVVGEGEIDCDEFGRIWVHFPWDLEATISMRCRVSQNWAGKGWGGMVIPRIGMEVVVEFLEGDPDKPLVTGCVYNGKNDVPYPLPAEKTKSTFKSDSHKGDGFNEIRFEDESGSEEIYVHAQKDRNEETLNDHSEEIGNDWSQWVGNDKEIEVTKDHDELIGGSMTIIVGPTGLGKLLGQGLSGVKGALDAAVQALGIPDLGGGDYMLIAEKNKTEMIGISSTTKVGIKTETQIGVSAETTIGSKSEYKVGSSIDVDSGTSIAVKSGQSIDVQSGKTIKVQSGELINMKANKNFGIAADDDIAVNAGKNMVVDVGDKLVLKCGKASIVLKKNGDIEIKGKNVKTQGSGKIDVKASKAITMKGSKISQN